MKRVLTPSLFITYPPNSKSIKGIFYSFHLSLILDKRKINGDSSYPHILDKTKKSVLPPYYKTGDSVREYLKKRGYLRVISLYMFSLFALFALNLRVAWIYYFL